ncbi:hypothetical protein OIU77_031514 [Salix suchowensis]|uniref:Uncharacterized protein n=1 Tax=Salix suchowensis TaxID=1278906 RepID=A0ABQ9BHR2_9ROSI|nr:hypothetical protein OIU77_031514 [Salix suchowensis]
MIVAAKSVDINMFCLRRGVVLVTHCTSNSSSRRVCGAVRASMVDSYESSSDFSKRMEQAWLISQQPRPVSCTSCDSNGHVECQWCRGTGFFILGDNMLCQVPSRNTTCVICAGKGSMRCSDFKTTEQRSVSIQTGCSYKHKVKIILPSLVVARVEKPSMPQYQQTET